MSDSEVFSESDSVSERRDTNCSPRSDLDDTGGHFVFRRDFAPYQGEPLSANGEMADNSGFSVLFGVCSVLFGRSVLMKTHVTISHIFGLLEMVV